MWTLTELNKEAAKVILENLDLPILAGVDSEYDTDLVNGWNNTGYIQYLTTIGTVAGAHIAKVLINHNGKYGTIFEYDNPRNPDEVAEYYFGRNYVRNHTSKEIEELYENLPWQKVVMVDILGNYIDRENKRYGCYDETEEHRWVKTFSQKDVREYLNIPYEGEDEDDEWEIKENGTNAEEVAARYEEND